jgi:1,4-alpha-glucan branching enzyme
MVPKTRFYVWISEARGVSVVSANDSFQSENTETPVASLIQT